MADVRTMRLLAAVAGCGRRLRAKQKTGQEACPTVGQASWPVQALFRSLLALGLLFPMLSCVGSRSVLMDHDGAIDDYVALVMLLNTEDRRLRGVTISFGNSYPDAAVEATRGILTAYRVSAPVGVFAPFERGRNEFPAEWRRTSAAIKDIPAFRGAEAGPAKAAGDVLRRALEGGGIRKLEVLVTGPLTNLAAALKGREQGVRHIRRLVVMGGALRVAGNAPDGAAEYNMFVDPEAADYVFSLAGIGLRIELIPLDATNYLPVTRQFVERLLASPKAPAQQAGQILSLGVDDHHYLWDGAAALALARPQLFTFVPLRLKVTPEGRTVESQDGHGPIQVALGIQPGARPMEEVLAILER